ncbi:cupin domain-containing protein [Actinocorallia lasiicapitis]
MLVRAAEQEVVLTAPKAPVHLLVEDADTTLYRSVLRDGSDGAPAHFHTRASEIFHVLSGKLEFLLDEEVLILGEGDTLVVPPRVPHAFGAVAGQDVEVLCSFTTGMGRFDYFRLLERVQRGEADPGEIAASAERFDNHYFVSPLWRKTRGHAA